MAERPILFSGPMVRALLAGTKTQTRRVIKDQQIGERFSHMTEDGRAHLEWLGTPSCGTGVWDVPEYSGQVASPYGQPGDRLWVRETTHRRPMLNLITGEALDPKYDGGAYSADGDYVLTPESFDVAWWYSRKVCPAIHMPRWASRILLEVTEVRVERLQDISAEDAQAEGITFTDYGRQCGHTGSGWTEVGGCDAPAETHPQRAGWGVEPTSHMQCMHSAPTAFAALWSQINGVDSWAANPWVWAVSFKPVPSPAEEH